VKISVTVKCRIGIDQQDPEAALDTLARGVVAAGTDALIVHARKAWLNGLSPRENRDIPPLGSTMRRFTSNYSISRRKNYKAYVRKSCVDQSQQKCEPFHYAHPA